jgi:Flp pilus assembly pilin Flp
MNALTPEQRHQIYLEEQARLEARRELDNEKKTGCGTMIGYALLAAFVGLVVLAMIGGSMESHHSAEWSKLTPEERHSRTLENCRSLMKDWAFHTYSELSVYERKMQFACEEQLAHPDEQVFRSSQ